MGTLDRFEGGYGAAYDAILQRPALRRAVFRAIGSAGPIVHLERTVAALVELVPEGVLLDAPCGGGTLLPLLQDAGFHGRVIGVDLAAAMLERAGEVAARIDGFDVELLHADVTALPLADGSVDAIASINGLHVLPEPAAALAEFARVLRPGGVACIVTITATRGLRNRALRLATRAGSVLPRDVETADELRAMLDAAGFGVERDFGGGTFAGLLVRAR